MKVLSVVCHPEPSSLTWSVHAAFREAMLAAAPDTELDLIDPHGDDFQPGFTTADLAAVRFEGPLDDQILDYQRRVNAADALLLVTPIYWWSVPAMLKGWFDRVFTNGWAYELTEAGVRGSLQDRPVQLLALGATDAEAYERHGYESAFHTQIDYGVFSYCGLTQIDTQVFFSVIDPEFGGVDPRVHLDRAAELGRSFGEKLLSSVCITSG